MTLAHNRSSLSVFNRTFAISMTLSLSLSEGVQKLQPEQTDKTEETENITRHLRKINHN